MRYFKVYEDTKFPEGHISYYEFMGEWCTRQIDIDDNVWRCADRSKSADRGNICDQPLSVIKFSDEEEISQKDFEEVWHTAHSRCE